MCIHNKKLRYQLNITIAKNHSTFDEYITTEACKENVWLTTFLRDLNMKQNNYTLYSDSQSYPLSKKIQLSTQKQITSVTTSYTSYLKMDNYD